MNNVFDFPAKPFKLSDSTVVSRWEEICCYGEVGPIRVTLARRLDAMPDLIHVVVLGSSCWVGVAPVASMPDNANGRAVADITGAAVVRAIEHAEVEFAAERTTC
ncbi:hypothetical protein [Methylobacterium sp. J-076]|uniref:hypothetical protein n=1 Tax=Methylobacterium sp. J-076 TaxID=2836655 RepID=UPI001FBB4167|nr:hypothetical protein [Methylobacterium sp. J-076]MCJ2014538.1 hypothetical protein [Methylobacterium sp. J-076]